MDNKDTLWMVLKEQLLFRAWSHATHVSLRFISKQARKEIFREFCQRCGRDIPEVFCHCPEGK